MAADSRPDRISQVLARSAEATLLVDSAGRVLDANEQALELFGYELQELKGRSAEALISGRPGKATNDMGNSDKGRSAERSLVAGLSVQGRRRNGDLFEAELDLATVETDEGAVVCSTVRKVTAEGSATAYFRNLLESAPDAMIIVDRDGAIEIANQQCEKMFGYSREELLGMCVDELLPMRFRGRHGHYREGYFEAPSIRPMGSGRELAGQRKDGTEFPVEISLSHVDGPHGTRVSSVIRDVTEQKNLESELIAARHAAERANRANTAFLAAASHDLRQPVQALSLLNGALRRTVESPLAQEMVESQQQSLDAMTNLLNSLLDISRLDAGKIEPEIEDFPITRLVDRLSSEFARQAAQKGLKFSGGDCDALVRSDPNLLSEIIQNFVSNALRYTPTGGEVAVSCEKGVQTLRINVRDTGIGIAADELETIFQEFHQVKQQGTEVEGFGLGLAIVRRLADLLGVGIDVESTPGKGSCFSVIVPLAESETVVEESDSGEDFAARQGAGGRVVLIEDDKNVANAWALLLAAEGFSVSRAVSVPEVEALIPTLSDVPELIISDYHLADGSTGVEAVRCLRKAFDTKIPAFIVSGDTSKVVDQAREVGNSVLMRKPINTDLLLSMAHDAIESGVIEET